MSSAKITKSKNSIKESSLANERVKLVEEIKKSNNILITVSRNPSVDALSAALGLTALIDKMGKHGTAIFSGKVPEAIKFLNPDKIFEETADSLRDFIIALSREKADHLRYRVDGDVVKIYVTPYKTIITEKDLEYSQGDYNVELVIALGVEDQKDLDVALASHGRILHDATVTTINVDEDGSHLGSINLHEKEASSLSEVVASIGRSLGNKDEELIDEQIATALMTGIVATTDRFRNDKTTPATMEISASLMSLGADQQLISSKLEEAKALPDEESGKEATKDLQEIPEKKVATANSDGSLTIDHSEKSNNSRLVISKLAHEDLNEPAKKEDIIRVPTATEILSQLAAEEKEKEQEQTKGQSIEQVKEPEVVTKTVDNNDTRTREYMEHDKKSAPPEDGIEISPHVSSEQSPSVGAEPLRERGSLSLDAVVTPLREIDTSVQVPTIIPKDSKDLPELNIDPSAEAILQAALDSATPTAQMTQAQVPTVNSIPVPPPPPPPPPIDLGNTPPPLPDFNAIGTQEVTPEPIQVSQEPSLAPPVVSTLPPEDMILAGSQQNSDANQPPDDPGQFKIPGQ